MTDKQFANTPPLLLANPAISVIIPMYNAEKYIGECLDSLLAQTFQNFEVIVVDDCSSDSSCEIIESYMPKFDGRLKLARTEKNSGGGGYVPRNIGLNLSCGEYVFFVDADDFILLTTLETLYSVAKSYDVEVVYTSAHYVISQPNDVYLCRDGEGKKFFREGKEDNPALLMVDDQNKILSELLTQEPNGNFRMPWTKFIQRDFLIKNNILFPEADKLTNGGDFIWTICVYACVKKFLRLPTPFYFYRTYNSNSVTRIKRTPQEQVARWIPGFIAWLKVLNELTNKFKELKDNPAYGFAAMKGQFGVCINFSSEARNELTSKDIYEVLCRELGNQRDLPAFAIPFFLSVIDEAKKANNKSLQTVDTLKKEMDRLIKNPVSSSLGVNASIPKNASSSPAISVVIPLYNAERYVADSLDSLLAQTFQDFEVVVVDDCSTDSSCKIVESYMPKFNDRLKLYRLKENSGSGGVPRTKAITLSRGDYISFLDADDMFTSVALEEMYSLAKEYNADVVYCEKHYRSDEDGSNILLRATRGASVSKPTFESQNLRARVDKIKKGWYTTVPWLNFVKRDLMIEDEVFFPQIRPSEDIVWIYALVCYAKKFLRVPNAVYIYRRSEGSMIRKERTPQETVNFRISPLLKGLKIFDNLLKHHEFFKANPDCYYDVLRKFFNNEITKSLSATQELADHEVYSTIKEKFGDKFYEYDVLISTLCTELYNSRRQNKLIDKYRDFLTARIDVKFMTTKGDFQILSTSDEEANVSKPVWFQKDGVGYVIKSLNGALTFVVKATADGKINLRLKSSDVRAPKDKSKHIPYWIDYTQLIVNGETIFDTLTPAWHDEPYVYNIDAKANEEIKIEVKWLPHRSDTVDVTALPPKVVTPPPPKVVTPPPLQFETARIDVKLLSKEGNFQMLSVSDDKANITKPRGLQDNGVGYMLTSSAGNLMFVAKATADGQINLKLRGLDIRDPKNKSKRIPKWIIYTKLIVNGETIFDELTPTWHDKPYVYKVDVKAGKELKIQLEWQPRKSEY